MFRFAVCVLLALALPSFATARPDRTGILRVETIQHSDAGGVATITYKGERLDVPEGWIAPDNAVAVIRIGKGGSGKPSIDLYDYSINSAYPGLRLGVWWVPGLKYSPPPLRIRYTIIDITEVAPMFTARIEYAGQQHSVKEGWMSPDGAFIVKRIGANSMMQLGIDIFNTKTNRTQRDSLPPQGVSTH